MKKMIVNFDFKSGKFRLDNCDAENEKKLVKQCSGECNTCQNSHHAESKDGSIN